MISQTWVVSLLIMYSVMRVENHGQILQFLETDNPLGTYISCADYLTTPFTCLQLQFFGLEKHESNDLVDNLLESLPQTPRICLTKFTCQGFFYLTSSKGQVQIVQLVHKMSLY